MVVSSSSTKLYKRERPLRDIVEEQIRADIQSGKIPPGTRLVERELAADLDVSRFPVREALRVLLREGLVEHLPSRGVQVRQLDRREVMQLFDIREALEVLATREAATRVAEGAPVGRLQETVALAKRAAEAGDVDAVMDANAHFHDEVLNLAGNDVLERLLEPIVGRLHWLFRQVPDILHVWQEHEDLAQAIVDGDVAGACDLAHAHVMTYRAITLEHLFQAD